jgi:hypothetical protein
LLSSQRRESSFKDPVGPKISSTFAVGKHGQFRLALPLAETIPQNWPQPSIPGFVLIGRVV